MKYERSFPTWMYMGMPLAVRADIDTDVRIVERTDDAARAVVRVATGFAAPPMDDLERAVRQAIGDSQRGAASAAAPRHPVQV